MVFYCCSLQQNRRTYFYSSFVAYILALLATIFVMHCFKHAQVSPSIFLFYTDIQLDGYIELFMNTETIVMLRIIKLLMVLTVIERNEYYVKNMLVLVQWIITFSWQWCELEILFWWQVLLNVCCWRALQPALLYLVPACIGVPLAIACLKGELGIMFKWVNRFPISFFWWRCVLIPKSLLLTLCSPNNSFFFILYWPSLILYRISAGESRVIVQAHGTEYYCHFLWYVVMGWYCTGNLELGSLW